MNFRIALVFAIAVGTLAGCATRQLPVAMTENALAQPANKIAVAMSGLPKVDSQFPGAGCLLCYAAASMANSTLTDYTRTLPYENLPELKNQVASALRKKGAVVTVMPDAFNMSALPNFNGSGPNIARKDFTGFKNKLDVDKMLVISFYSVGINRTYAQYFPTGEPKASVSGSAALINLSNNTYEWFMPFTVEKSADGKWDEPPKFPGLTNAYFQALEMTADKIIQPIVN